MCPESLLGMLQRGRGRGLQEAIRDGAGEMVVRCIEDGLRWDGFEERGWYFARLLTEMGIPVDAVSCDFTDEGFLSSMWCEALLALAGEGSRPAVDVLHFYVAGPAPDRLVGEAVDLIWDEAGSAGRQGLREVVLARASGELLREWAHPRAGGPWVEWRDVPAIGSALEAWAYAPVPAAPDLSRLDRSALVHGALEWPHGRERRAAFVELGRLGDPVLLEIAENPRHRTNCDVVPGLERGLRELGAGALDRARRWVRADDEYLRFLAGRVLARVGELADGPALVVMLGEAADEHDWTRTEHLAAGVARLGEVTAAPALLRAWRETLHSHARADYLRALVALRVEALPDLQAEATGDCESEVRGLVG